MKTHSHHNSIMVILGVLGLGALISPARAQDAAPAENPEAGLVAEQPAPAAAEPAQAGPADEAPPDARGASMTRSHFLFPVAAS